MPIFPLAGLPVRAVETRGSPSAPAASADVLRKVLLHHYADAQALLQRQAFLLGGVVQKY